MNETWIKQFDELKRKTLPLVILVSILCFLLCYRISHYSLRIDPTSMILYLFVIPGYYLLIAYLNRQLYFGADKYLVLVISRKGMLGYLKGMINRSTKSDWYKMGFTWWLLPIPKPWCRFTKIKKLKRSC